MLGDFTFEDLAQAAVLGCNFCTSVKAGVLAFARGDQVSDIRVAQSVEMGGDDLYGKHRNGCMTLLHVEFKTVCGKKTQLTFYTADDIVTSFEPRFRKGPHVVENPLSVDCLSKARTWLDRCLLNHSSLRCLPMSEKPLPTRVIDVGTHLSSPFLYESEPGEVGIWAALSYCWGKSQAVTTTSASLAKHKCSLALGALPSTCRDAILAARAMSIRYVWIDALCIVQDSAEDWQSEASRMCFVYENAIITFVAPEASSSDVGLSISNPRRGTVEVDFEMSHNSERRHGVVYVREAMPSQVFPLHVHRTNPSPKSIINTRAWTMQELLLSPRILWFGSAEIGWSCWSATACECQPRLTFEYLDIEDRSPQSHLMKISSSRKQIGKPNTDWGRTWCGLVEQYTSRRLTVATDRLPAMSGLAAAVGNHLPSNYLAGIWRSQLASQLLWYSAWTVQPSDSDAYSQTLEDDYAPSWTWASVPGSIVFDINNDVKRSSQVWRVVAADFHHLDIDHFGRGKGSITLESYLWPICGARTRLKQSSDFDGHALPNDVPIVDENDIIWDPRPKTRAWNGDDPVNEQLWFFAGALVQSSKHQYFVSCKGLVLERLPDGNTYKRLGGGVAPLGKSASKDWNTWKQKAQWATVILV